MEKLSFFNPVSSSDGRFKVTAFFDDYFSPFSGRCYDVISGSGRQYVVSERYKKTSLLAGVLKIASYFTIVLPLIMALGKACNRSYYSFCLETAHSQAKANHLQKTESTIASTVSSLKIDSSRFSQKVQKQGQQLLYRAKTDGVIAFYLDETDPVTGVFGNFHIHDDSSNKRCRLLGPDNRLYLCAEAAFQANKFPDHYRDAFTELNGEQAFQLKKQLEAKRLTEPGWIEKGRYDAMLAILRNKFDSSSHPELAWLLEQTGHAALLEHNMKHETETTWSDAIYGEGYNVLGRMLEQVREENRTKTRIARLYHDSKGVPNLTKAKSDERLKKLYQMRPKPQSIVCDVKGCMRPKHPLFATSKACGKTHAHLLIQKSNGLTPDCDLISGQ